MAAMAPSGLGASGTKVASRRVVRKPLAATAGAVPVVSRPRFAPYQRALGCQQLLNRRSEIAWKGCTWLELCNRSLCKANADSRDTGNESESDYLENKVQQVDLELPRRSMSVTFTCNACGGRTERLVNPLAWEKGMVIVQCEKCKKWHKIADAAGMVEEYVFSSDESGNDNMNEVL